MHVYNIQLWQSQVENEHYSVGGVIQLQCNLSNLLCLGLAVTGHLALTGGCIRNALESPKKYLAAIDRMLWGIQMDGCIRQVAA